MGVIVPSNTGIIKLDGRTIRNKPIDAVTIALWANFTTVQGTHTLFETIGGHSMHTMNQYELSVNDGAVLWRHRNDYNQIVFEVQTGALILPGEHFSAVVSLSHLDLDSLRSSLLERLTIYQGRSKLYNWGGGVFIYSCSQTIKTVDFKGN